MKPTDRLCEQWRERAAELRRYGAKPQAITLERCAEELEAKSREHELEELTLDQAAEFIGVTRRTIERRIERGDLPQVGEEGRPRVRRRDLMPGTARDQELVTEHGEPDVAEELLLDRY